MSRIITSRRGLFKGLAALIAAPAIIRVADLMPIRQLKPDSLLVVTDYEFTANPSIFAERMIVHWDYGNEFTVQNGDIFTVDFDGPLIALG